MTLDETNGRIRIGRKNLSGDWKDASFNSKTIFQKSDIGFGPSSFEIDRNTGSYEYKSKTEMSFTNGWAKAVGDCNKEVPKKF